jgi:hypothetical protein
MAGGSIYDASKNLGHASVAFTAAVYGHLSGDHRVAESDRLSFKLPADATAKVIAFEAPPKPQSRVAITRLLPTGGAPLACGSRVCSDSRAIQS